MRQEDETLLDSRKITSEDEYDSDDIGKRLKILKDAEHEEPVINDGKSADAEEPVMNNSKSADVEENSEMLMKEIRELLPGKLVNLVNPKTDLFKVRIVLNSVEIVAVVDTGAATSLINSNIVLNNNFALVTENSKFDALGSHSFQSCCCCCC